VGDTACHAGEWSYQPLRFESAALRGDHCHLGNTARRYKRQAVSVLSLVKRQ
jgi:hypothetical protein